MKQFNTGVASEYYVLSLLYRLEYEAYITIGNKKSVDIRVISPHATFSVDVKAVQGYSSIIVNNAIVKSDHFYIFLIYNNKFSDINTMPELYVVPSSELPSITKSFKDQKRIFKSDLVPYKDKWDLLPAANVS